MSNKLSKIKDAKERSRVQLDLWVKGESLHDIESDSCCIDGSCCLPELKTQKWERETFARIVESGKISVTGEPAWFEMLNTFYERRSIHFNNFISFEQFYGGVKRND